MVAQYYDEAAGYVPRFVMNRWGAAVVMTMLALSIYYSVRFVVGQFPGDRAV